MIQTNVNIDKARNSNHLESDTDVNVARAFLVQSRDASGQQKANIDKAK